MSIVRNKIFYILSLALISVITVACFKAPKTGKPTHIRAVLKSDPATSITIGWNKFAGKNKDDIFYYDTVDHGTEEANYKISIAPHYYSNFGNSIKSSFVHLKNLTPSTRYYFLIKNSFGKSKRFYFDTLSDQRDERVSIIAGGDSRNNRKPRQAANKLVAKLKPHLVLFGGDMTDKGSPEQWWRWFDDWGLTHGPDGRVTPIAPARGNHEFGNTILKKLFWLPSKNYYKLSIGQDLLKVYVLNSESSAAGNQRLWLKKDLEETANNYTWKFAQYHKPMRPHVKGKREGGIVYDAWARLFYDNGVDLVMESDSHTVKSTWPIRPTREDEESDEGFVRDDERGTIYVGEGCWGAPLRNSDDRKSWTRSSGVFNQFKLIFVSVDEVEVRTIKVDNADNVLAVSLENRFELPKNLDVWKPENGEVIRIK